MELAPKPSLLTTPSLTSEDNLVGPPPDETPAEDVAAEQDEPFIDGFSWRTVIGALFIGLIMMPGAIYLSLVTGAGLGPAAEWVTVILFLEVARRSFQTLKKQELYLLYYMGASLTAQIGGVALAGGVFANMIWNQYTVHSQVAQQLGITQGLRNEGANWVVPYADSPALAARTFMHPDWLPAIAMMGVTLLLGRMTQWGLGYVMFRITSDVEKLPFPLASIASEGATALAESSSQKEGWRWRVFSIGAMMGVGWGAMYVLLPAVTSIMFNGNPITILTVPFIDLTSSTQGILPAARVAIGTDIGSLLIGFILPWPVVVGTFIACIGCQVFGNPILYNGGILQRFGVHGGLLHTWNPGSDYIQTALTNNVDFWLSFGIGTSAAIGVIGITSAVIAVSKTMRRRGNGERVSFAPPPGRGDIPIWMALAVWAVGTVGFIAVCHRVVPSFPISILLFFGFIWTPISSYITARMSGIAGQNAEIPFVREASFMMAGGHSTAIWFAPIPLSNVGGMAQQFRTVELTRTKFTSIIKVELLMLPVMLVCSFVFWNFIWRLAPIPSSVYPYASKFWAPNAQMQLLFMTSNRSGPHNYFLEHVIHTPVIAAGGVITAVLFALTVLLGLPQMLFYGLISGTQADPSFVILMFIGALLGRFYFEKRFGAENWRAYAPVLTAGYYCGMGLIGMAAVSLALLSKSVSPLPF
jgi:hypothetical protein